MGLQVTFVIRSDILSKIVKEVIEKTADIFLVGDDLSSFKIKVGSPLLPFLDNMVFYTAVAGSWKVGP